MLQNGVHLAPAAPLLDLLLCVFVQILGIPSGLCLLSTIHVDHFLLLHGLNPSAMSAWTGLLCDDPKMQGVPVLHYYHPSVAMQPFKPWMGCSNEVNGHFQRHMASHSSTGET